MKLILILLLTIAGLGLLVRLLESKSRFGLGLLVVLLFVGISKWTDVQPLPSVWHGGGYAVATEDSDQADAAAKIAVASEAVEEAAPATGRVGDATPPEAENSEDDGDDADSDSEIDADEELKIQLVPEEGKPIRPAIPESKSWVDSEPVLEGDVHTMAVSSGPHETLQECRRSLDEKLKAAVDEYIDWYLGKVYGNQFKASNFVDFDASYVRANLINVPANPDGVYSELIKFSIGPMHQTHSLVRFGPEFRTVLDHRRSEIDHRWKRMRQTGRLLAAALGFGFILAVLGVVFGYFRLDTATRGYYTGRLQFIAAVAILAAIVAGLVLARQVPWI